MLELTAFDMAKCNARMGEAESLLEAERKAKADQLLTAHQTSVLRGHGSSNAVIADNSEKHFSISSGSTTSTRSTTSTGQCERDRSSCVSLDRRASPAGGDR